MSYSKLHEESINEKGAVRSSNDPDFHVQSIYSLMTKTDEQIVDEIGEQKKEGENDLEDVEGGNGRKSIFHRMFSKMEAGSLRGSIFAMSSLALGTGCLALPLRFSQMSMLCALIVVVLGSAAAYWSLVIMIEASKKTKSTDYSTLVKETLGGKLSLILDFTILIYIFGILISYQVISNYFFINLSLPISWFICLPSRLHRYLCDK
jgi:hypothetical protein